MVHVVLPLMLAATLPFALTLATKVRGFTPRDNHRTREWQAGLEGWRKRAYWAHQNALETLPLFIAAVLCAHLASPGSPLAAGLAWAYPGARIVYSILYVTDRAALRTIVWFLAMGLIIALFLVALTA